MCYKIMFRVGGGLQLPRVHLSSKCVSTLIITGLGKALVHLKLCSVTSRQRNVDKSQKQTIPHLHIHKFSFSPCAILIHPHKTSLQPTSSLMSVLKLGQRVEVTCKIMHFSPEINI